MAQIEECEMKCNNNINDSNVELFMLTVKGLEKCAKDEIEELLNPISVRIIPIGIIITKFNEISVSLMKNMKSLRSVSKIVYLVDELYDIPLKEVDINNYLNDKILKITRKLQIKWEIGYKCWKYSCCNNKLYINNPSIPIKTRNRFEKEINKLNNKNKNKNKNNQQNDKLNKDKLHEIDINFDCPVYRSKCDRKGQHEWCSLLIEKEIATPIHDILGFEVNLKYYDIEIFSFIRNVIMLYGISIVSDLHIRNRISRSYSTILNNNICYLVGKIADIKDNMVILDPMCGVGSTIIECKLAFYQYQNVKYIGTDLNDKAIKQALLNAKYCDIKVNEGKNKGINDNDIDFKDCEIMEFYAEWDISKLTEKQIKNECIDIIISDLPFGHKCGSHKKNRKLYPLMLESMNRILKINGKALLITMERKLLSKLLDHHQIEWKYNTMEIDVGGFDALLFIIIKIGKYKTKSIENQKCNHHNNNNNDNDHNNDDIDHENQEIKYRKMSLDSQ